MAPAIGIDLGTTYSCVAVYEEGDVTIIFNQDDGRKVTPSWVAFVNGETIVGAQAKQQSITNPSETIYEVKRIIGRNYYDESIQSRLGIWPFEVTNVSRKPMVRIKDGGLKLKSPEEISGMILAKMKSTAEAYLGRDDIEDAVITVPAQFNDSQRRATVDAAEMAGLNVLGLLVEPTAAAIAYELAHKQSHDRQVLVFDLGGGTFDVSLLKIAGDKFEVLGTNGDTALGGVDFDDRLSEYLRDVFTNKHKIDLSLEEDTVALRRLRQKSESLKISLSNAKQINFTMDSLVGGIDFSWCVTREKFEELNKDLFVKILDTVRATMADAKADVDTVDYIVLAGGSSRIPKLKRMLADVFGGDKICNDINPDEVVAYGAAYHAAALTGRLSSKDKYKLVDISPMSIGIEDYYGEFRVIIPRNTPLPASGVSHFYSTNTEEGSTIEIPIYEGERIVARDNNRLGTIRFNDRDAALTGCATFKLAFEIDTNGILECRAEELATGRKEAITLHCNKGKFTPEEIECRSAEISKFATTDRDRMAVIILKKRLTDTCSNLQKASDGLDLNAKKLLEIKDICLAALAWKESSEFNPQDCEIKIEHLNLLLRDIKIEYKRHKQKA